MRYNVLRKINIRHIVYLYVIIVVIIIITKSTKLEKHVITTDLINQKDTIENYFIEYERMANEYLFEIEKVSWTPINGYLLAKAAKITYDSTGIIVPLELALSQAKLETNMGNIGRSPLTNPFNVGEWEEGTKISFKNTFEGIFKYYLLIANNYLRCKDNIDSLLKDFTNCNGHRYATDKDYENKIKFLIKNMKKK